MRLCVPDSNIERGLDPDLTYYPAIAFDQAITNAGVKRAPPPYIHAYASCRR